MRSFAFVLAFSFVLGMAGCGDKNSPSVPAVTVTVLSGGTPVDSWPVTASTGVNGTSPTEVLGVQDTNSQGQTTFTVPSSTSTGVLCFTVVMGGTSQSDCRSLNALVANIQFTF